MLVSHLTNWERNFGQGTMTNKDSVEPRLENSSHILQPTILKQNKCLKEKKKTSIISNNLSTIIGNVLSATMRICPISEAEENNLCTLVMFANVFNCLLVQKNWGLN